VRVALSILCVWLAGSAVAQAPAALPPDADGVFRLKAQAARVVGTTLKVENTWGVPNLGYWSRVQDKAEWRIDVRQPGTYRVEIDFSCAIGSEGGEFELWFGPLPVVFRPFSTGGWGDFTAAKLGVVELPEAGPLTVRAGTTRVIRAGILNLREVRLRGPL
jgi:hypothetical protein